LSAAPPAALDDFLRQLRRDPGQSGFDATLACLGHHYRDAVLLHPDGDKHMHIRSFMVSG